MASKRAAIPAKHLFNGFRAYDQPVRQPFQQCLTRSMATEAPLPNATLSKAYDQANLTSASTHAILEDNFDISPPEQPLGTSPGPYQPPQNPFLSTTTCTLYNFPSMEPTSFTHYPSTHLLLPTRRDILHRAVIYEGDATRQGTASTKWRSEVHGSNRKIRPQKGTGRARLGDKKSPMLRGGGVAFGPKPRDFSTELPKKIYDMAWRMALSWRYSRGELIVTNTELDIPGVHENSLERYVRDMLNWNGLGKTLFVSEQRREGLFGALEGQGMRRHARALEVDLVDVKDLLEGSRVVVERTALERMLRSHETDLPMRQRLNAWAQMAPLEGAPSAEASMS